MVILRTLLENNLSRNRALAAQHGLSFLVETGGRKLLFDCSAGKAARKNAEKMHVSLKDVDYVIVSHSHYDHAGGYPDMASHGVHAPLVTGPRFFEEKYARNGDIYTYLGCGFGPELLKKKGIGHLVCEETMPLFDGCYVVGGFARTYEFEKPPARFVRLTGSGMVEDDFPDEVCLVLEDPKGLIVIAGCSHPGILNMLETVRSRFGRPVYAVFGGSHLVEADEDRLSGMIDIIRDMGIRMAGFNHCTGDEAQERLRAAGGGTVYTHLKTGDCIFLS
ncbi:MAG: MBL fold metallo-hydrolase [Lachnospiraceae bacterium]|jgi:7,8-dihydropterin-6-yl-methyl-4-(beta-D-ribofuranosyl)aminobenzene 5'-phosphate synthase|nr:MBL fold metallo-hydrolase [Lachnospiraceae bacterium]